MKALFTTTAVLLMVLGIAWLAAPGAMLVSWNVEPDPAAVYMGRRYAGLLLGYALLLWLARSSPPSPAREAIVISGMAVSFVMAALSLLGVLTGTVGPMVWSAVGIELGLAIWFARVWAGSRRGVVAQPAM